MKKQQKDLSILIPTLPARIEEYCNLMRNLNTQIIKNKLAHRVQILSLCDTKEKSVGQKRNILLNESCGKYVCFIDDDDTISPNYLNLILNSIDKSNADVITFCGDYVQNNQVTPFSISCLHRKNYNEKNMFYRLPNHLCPVKRELALDCMFTNKNFGEDSDYSELLNKLITNEYHINEKLYFYMYDDRNSQTNPNNNLSAFS